MNEISMMLAAAGSQRLTVDDVFSVNTYRGSSGAVAIKSGVNLAAHNGVVWTKDAKEWDDHNLRIGSSGWNRELKPNSPAAMVNSTHSITPSATGHTVAAGDESVNYPGALHCSWTMRVAPKFLDVVSYTGNGASARNIAHRLGVTPGLIMIKRVDEASDWSVYHKDLHDRIYYGGFLLLHSASEVIGHLPTEVFASAATAAQFSIGSNGAVNASGGQYVALVFAHDPTADGMIACGVYETPAGSIVATLPWEPQFVMTKRADASGNWLITDSKRGAGAAPGISWTLSPNLQNQGASNTSTQFNQDGFVTFPGGGAGVHVWVAIRGGASRKKLTAPEVFDTVLYNGSSASQDIRSSTLKDADLGIWFCRNNDYERGFVDRIRGEGATFDPASGAAQEVNAWSLAMDLDGSMRAPSTWYNVTGEQNGIWMFKRARGFFDIVRYQGNDADRMVPHRLGVQPALWIIKRLTAGGISDGLFTAGMADAPGQIYEGTASESSGAWGSAPTVGAFRLATPWLNSLSSSYVAYLWANCPGVSRVGRWTGTGADVNIDCGFSGSARFVMFRAVPTGAWWVVDAARGIATASSPVAFLASASRDQAGALIKPYAGGFTAHGLASPIGQQFIYLAIA